MRRTWMVFGISVVLAVILLACQSSSPTGSDIPPQMIVYKSPTCGCCTAWAEIMQRNGFRVQMRNVSDLMAIKAEYNVPEGLMACHTAVVDGYVIEGHVPVQDVVRLLRERPNALGIAVPGMPRGAPGMDAPVTDPYTVYLFDEGGQTSVFASYE